MGVLWSKFECREVILSSPSLFLFLFFLIGSSPFGQDLGGNLGLDDLLATSLDAGKDALAVLVKLELGDDHV